MKIGYICDNCHKAHLLRIWVFNCVECGKEICEDCMHGWATCKECAVGYDGEFLEARFEKIHE